MQHALFCDSHTSMTKDQGYLFWHFQGTFRKLSEGRDSFSLIYAKSIVPSIYHHTWHIECEEVEAILPPNMPN